MKCPRLYNAHSTLAFFLVNVLIFILPLLSALEFPRNPSELCFTPNSMLRSGASLIASASTKTFALNRFYFPSIRSGGTRFFSRRRSFDILATLLGGAQGNIIDGKEHAKVLLAEARVQCDDVFKQFGTRPGLAVVIVGSRRDSQVYVRNKERACAECGVVSIKHEVPEDASQEEVVALVRRLNRDENVHAVLVQLPLPPHMSESAEIAADKDADGFHPLNVGMLAMRGRTPAAEACTPAGVMELLRRTGVRVAGATAVVIGRSNVVGMPMALMLLRADATVQVVHSATPPSELR
eukprot:CAMPEP_0172151106 /NCGR_PEP_ID=MMETSP1050-20130122/37_1 /TAXON_ID=233186 /ORGANISM="Cryptomonas curvata, Strain CCAP979/52" /LENGTH=294 /DNA_ID=CAMNT_0012819159 /DNA_START=86 /DNA_END=966 /DNA_ORIENTATION=+